LYLVRMLQRAPSGRVHRVTLRRPMAAQDEESGLLGGEAGRGGGLGALTSPAGTFSAASHKTSTSRSPAFASSMIVLAMISSSGRSRTNVAKAALISRLLLAWR